MENAVCKYCGQVSSFEVPEGATREEALEIGTMHCGCPPARTYREMQKKVGIAKAELSEMLLSDDEARNLKAVDLAIFDLLSGGIELMAKDKIFKINVGLSSGGTVEIKAGAGGKISLKRSVALTNKREV